MTEQELTKTCTKCKVSKPHSEFYKRAASQDGLSYVCKACYKIKYYETEDNTKLTHNIDELVISKTKLCSNCKETKPRSEFGKNRKSPDGINYACKACHKVRNKAKSAKTKLALEANPNLIPATKVCRSCKEEKASSEFSKNRSSKDGLRNKCKACDSAYLELHKDEIAEAQRIYRDNHKVELSEKSKAYRESHRDTILAKKREYYESHKEAFLENQKEYREAHKETIAEYMKQYRFDNAEARALANKEWYETHKEITIRRASEWAAANPEKAREICRAIKKANPEKVNADTAQRRAIKLKATPPWYEREAVRRIYAESMALSKAEGVVHHVDHIVPLRSKFVCGLHCLANLQILRAKDNQDKGNRHWPDMWEITEEHYTMLESIAAQPEEE
jgi:hypothetical protein